MTDHNARQAGLTDERIADAIPKSSMIVTGVNGKSVLMTLDDLREFTTAILAAHSADAQAQALGFSCASVALDSLERRMTHPADARNGEGVNIDEAFDSFSRSMSMVKVLCREDAHKFAQCLLAGKSRDGTLTAEEAVNGVVDLFPSADRQALKALAELLCKPGTAAPAPMEMALCEQAHLILKPGQLYRFTAIEGCEQCALLAFGGEKVSETLPVGTISAAPAPAAQADDDKAFIVCAEFSAVANQWRLAEIDSSHALAEFMRIASQQLAAQADDARLDAAFNAATAAATQLERQQSATPAEPEHVCKCAMTQKLVGDGCVVCNPDHEDAPPRHAPGVSAASAQPDEREALGKWSEECKKWGHPATPEARAAFIDGYRARQQSATPAEPAISIERLANDPYVAAKAWRKSISTPPECTCPSGNGSLRHPCPVHAVEPVAWSYECRQPFTDPPIWAEFFGRDEPKSDRHIRNVRALYATPADAASEADKVDAERYRFIVKHKLILSGGHQKFGWPISPFGEQCARYIDAAIQRERHQDEVRA